MIPILEIRNVSKKFKIDHERKPYLSLRESISNFFVNFNTVHEDFYALRGIDMKIFEGETVGIIGRNGAGKSTLLKILSRITPPSSGKIVLRGRIASLLEVGTGFHPELSGRENVFLNGSILGMKRKEIQNRFDEIVDFSGVEKFLDTPLKHYSSGMQLRLAFAVAAFLDPEILIIDEVLAVGDHEFQKKCLRQMEDVSKSGRTILFVSHNMTAVKKLCKKGALLNNGKLEMFDEIQPVINRYTENFEAYQTSFDIKQNISASAPGFAKRIVIENEKGTPTNNFPVGQPWQLRIEFTIRERIRGFIIGIGFMTIDDISLRTTWSEPMDIDPGDYDAVFAEEKVMLATGNYKIIVGLSARLQSFHYAENCAVLRISDEISDSSSSIKFSQGVGLILNPLRVSINKLNA